MFLAADTYDSTQGRGPFDDFWYGPVPGRTGAGVRVDPDSAMRLATLYGCVQVISQDLAKVPLVMYRRTTGGGRERVTDHPVVKLLAQPTQLLSGMEWKQRQQANQLLAGNAYAEKRFNFRGEVRELYPWRPDLVRTEVMPDESVRYHVRDAQTGQERIYLQDEVFHQRGLSLDGPKGLSPIDQMRETLGEGIATQQYGASFFANDARPSLWLEHPTHFKDEGVRKEWLRAFKQAFGGANRFSPMITEYGIKLNALPAVNHADLQFIELRKMKANEICAIYRVPPHKVGILERSTNNNIEHQGIEYVTDCLLTWCRLWEERLKLDLLLPAERDEYYFEFMLDALMRGDAKSRFEAYTAAVVAGGWMTRNEVRRRENLDELPGLDVPLEPLNMVPAGSQPRQPGTTDSAPNDTAPNDAQEARAAALELQARRRVLNRETRALEREWIRTAGNAEAFGAAAATFYERHAIFVEEALGLSPKLAAHYCVLQVDALAKAMPDHVPDLLVRWEACAELLKFDHLPEEETKT